MTERGDGEAFVFVSYSRKDKARVTRLIDELASRGINIWWDGNIEPGSAWREQIQFHLDQAACTLVVWTEHSVASQFVRDEASSSTALVPVRLDTAARIPVGFGELQYTDLTDWDGGSSPQFDKLVATLSRFMERGSRPIDQWLLENRQWQIDHSVSATADLRDKVGRLRSIAEVSASGVSASDDLRATLDEIDNTYKAVNEAVKRFLAPAAKQDEIDATPYLELERDAFRRQVERGVGHCQRIALHYRRHGGLRDWLKARVQPEQLQEADDLFASFSHADLDVFGRMVSIADLLKNESRAIVNLIFADQWILARERIKGARQALVPLEEELSSAMRELQEIRAVLGYP